MKFRVTIALAFCLSSLVFATEKINEENTYFNLKNYLVNLICIDAHLDPAWDPKSLKPRTMVTSEPGVIEAVDAMIKDLSGDKHPMIRMSVFLLLMEIVLPDPTKGSLEFSPERKSIMLAALRQLTKTTANPDFLYVIERTVRGFNTAKPGDENVLGKILQAHPEFFSTIQNLYKNPDLITNRIQQENCDSQTINAFLDANEEATRN